ncbi:hypothetical protein TNCV_2606431 [Trichonephila clavipes]|nr:hypothetical protein TNCV_2606431 [Trichonephila clavipes]
MDMSTNAKTFVVPGVPGYIPSRVNDGLVISMKRILALVCSEANNDSDERCRYDAVSKTVRRSKTLKPNVTNTFFGVTP